MRTAVRFPSLRVLLLASAGLLAVGGSATAEAPRVRITDARVGLPPGGRGGPHVCKFAAWVPVYIDLEVQDGFVGPTELVVETPDADGVLTMLAKPLDLSGFTVSSTIPAGRFTAISYLRPAAVGETTITVRTTKGELLTEPFRIRSLGPKAPLTYVVLALGSQLPDFDLPQPSSGSSAEATSAGPLRGGRVELASITNLGQLPDQWFGYDAADVVVLTTASGGLFEQLFSDTGRAKRDALLEWVRRGGRLVISLGDKAGTLSDSPALQDLLPFVTQGSRSVPQLALYWSARETSQASTVGGNLVGKGGPFPVAKLVPKPHQPGRVVIPPPNRQADDKNIIAGQAGYGLGRVTVVGFDLDRPPFTEFAARAEFWDWVLREGGASRASVGSEGKLRPAAAGPTDEEDELAAALRTHVDTFDGVPVVSFGWVAVLIVLYILLIGPVEYYLLKRLLGRLELTWLTFPLIVASVCAAAYFTALAVKGRDTRVNKVDVIDVVADFDTSGKPGGRVFGTTWFTVFSPRIDNYTVGVSPAEGWVSPGAATDPLVGWVGGPRGGRAGLIRRRYEVHTDRGAVADGLNNVPVQVWSTKSFTANWEGPVAADHPVVESRLEHPPGDPAKAIGTFVNRMPFDQLNDCVAFYSGQAYPLGTIVRDQEVRLVLDKGQPAAQLLQERGQLAEALARAPAADRIAANPNRTGAATGTTPTARAGGNLPLLGVLFHEAALRNDEGVIPRNASLRRLDQSWRLAPDNRGEVVVVGRVLPPQGSAEELFGGPTSPSRLWLKGLPGTSGSRPGVAGVGRQETYVRLYLPVRTAGPASQP